MLVTEAEAKTKHCCETLAAVTQGDGWVVMQSHTCLASDCMAWRWGQNLDRSLTKVGYCGKAGKP